MNASTTTTTTKSKNKPPKSTPSTFIKIIEFWFYLIQILTVLFSWRVYFLFIDSKKKIENNNNNNDNDNNNTNKNDEKRYLTFKEKVQHNFFCLFTDTLYFMMLIITCTLFFWRSKDTLSLLKKSDSSKYKQIIWDQFSGGFVEFGSFTVLLLLKWPVIFKVFWNKGTEKEDKSTWSQIFMREFSQEVDKNKLGVPKPPTTNTTNFSGNGSSSSTTNATSSSSSSSSQANNKRAMSDDEWRHAFRRDLQNIGFEFDSQTGDVSKFPPTEVMEQYQKSAEFRDLILASGSLKAGEQQQQNKNNNNNNNNNNNGPKIEEYDDQKQEEEEEEENETNKQQTQKDDEKKPSTTTTTTTTSSSNKKSKKGKKNKRN
ncbi:hypothetical protein ACTFIW_000314 [Dictyostelium discoideum]